MNVPSIPLAFERLEIEEMRRRGESFLDLMKKRRTVRDFAPDPVPPDVIDAAIAAASTAPSGANKQPWRFVVVRDPAVKREIREAAEAEEREFYEGRVTPEWREDLAILGTDWHKPFLEIAPCLIIVFAVQFDVETLPDGSQQIHKNYYVQESVGIAVGFLIAALHNAGLTTLTHTPSPMGFLGKVLGRPKNERAFVLLPVGYPAPGARVPDIAKKSLDEVRLLA
jgi:nitroreductase